MSYDLYFAGTTYKPILQLMKEMNVCKLYTQLTERRVINDWAQAKGEGITKGKLFVDSGAFTAHTKGVKLDMDEYCAYANGLGENVDLIAEMDHIPGIRFQKRTPEDIVFSSKKSWENYLYMRDHIEHTDKLIPIFHQDEEMRWLRNMLDWTSPEGKHIPYIGISSSKDKPAILREEWYYKVFSVIHASRNPEVKTHSFGTSSVTHMEKFPFTSSDATSWIRFAANGCILTPFGVCLVSDQTKQSSSGNDNDLLISEHREMIEEYVVSLGLTLEEVASHNSYRQIVNLKYFKNWADNYVYKGPAVFKQRTLI